MQLGMIGLGRMGANIVRRVMRDGHTCVVWDVKRRRRSPSSASEGATGAATLEEFVAKLDKPRVAWVMIPAGLTGKIGRGARQPDGGRRHHHRRRQLELPRRHRPRADAARKGHSLRRHRHERRRVRSGARLLPDDRRRRRGRRVTRSAAQVDRARRGRHPSERPGGDGRSGAGRAGLPALRADRAPGTS